MAKEFPVEKLYDLIEYNPDTGKMYWKTRISGMFPTEKELKRWNTRYAEKEISSRDSENYVRITIYGTLFRAHRVAWAMHHGEWPKNQIDHINGVKHDNRIENLRDVDSSTNSKNRKICSRNTSGVVGVSLQKNMMWKAKIINKYLGSFKNIEDAIAARKKAEIEYGFHENHGRVLTEA